MNSPDLRLVADVDTGIDDALALIYLYQRHRAGHVELSVTTSAGNCTAADAARNSIEVLRVAAGASPSSDSGRHRLPRVTCGALSPRVLSLVTTPETHGPRGLGYWVGPEGEEGEKGDCAAVEGSAAAAVAHWAEEKPSHLLVSGPATNLAWAVEHAPEVLRDCQVTIMGGAFGYPGNTTPTAEWNVWVDPHALGFALQRWPEDVPLPIIAPLNVTEQVELEPERLDSWVAALDGVVQNGAGWGAGSSELGRLLRAACEFYFDFHEKVGVGYKAQIHDLAAAMVLLGDVSYEASPYHVAVETQSELTRGTTLAFDPEPAFGPHRTPNARIVESIDAEGVLGTFGKVLILGE